MATAYMNMDFTTIFTSACGNCAPDTIALHEGLPSSALSWKSIRLRVSKKMKALSEEKWYVDAFSATETLDAEARQTNVPSEDQAFSRDPLEQQAFSAAPPASSDQYCQETKAVSAIVDACTALSAGIIGGECIQACGEAIAAHEAVEQQIVVSRYAVTRRRNRTTKLVTRSAIGKRYLLAREKDDTMNFARFAARELGFRSSRDVLKAARMFVKRCVLLAQSNKMEITTVGKGRGHFGSTIRTTLHRRKRAHGLQGRPTLCPELREVAII